MTTINARSTKAQLLVRISDLEREAMVAGQLIAGLRTELSVATRNAPPAARALPRHSKVVPTFNAWQRPAHMEAARQAAMATGLSVKVGA
jgi:hypothetical protein